MTNNFASKVSKPADLFAHLLRLEEKARNASMSMAEYRRIQHLGDSDEQIKERIREICRFLEYDPSDFGA